MIHRNNCDQSQVVKCPVILVCPVVFVVPSFTIAVATICCDNPDKKSATKSLKAAD